jgi:NitT/TauT family transport system substrate-binding protein
MGMNLLMNLGLGCAALTLVATGAAQAQQTPWRHGIVEAKSDAGIVLMADKKGFAKQHGLDLQILQFTGDALALKALIAGDLDSYEGSPGAPLIADSRGANVKIVGCYWPGLTYGIFSKTSVNSVEDLRGKTLGTSSPGALPDLIVRAALDHYDIPGSSITMAAMGTDTDRIRAVAAGVVDAAAASTEFLHFAQSQGIKLLVHAHDVVPNYLRFCTYVNAKTLADHKDQLANYLAAQMEGVRYALDHRDETIALSQELTKAGKDDPRATDVFDEVQKYSAVDPAMPVPVDRLDWMQNLLLKTGNLKNLNDLSTLVDDSARSKALTLVRKND